LNPLAHIAVAVLVLFCQIPADAPFRWVAGLVAFSVIYFAG
jgi:hypothetical protein